MGRADEGDARAEAAGKRRLGVRNQVGRLPRAGGEEGRRHRAGLAQPQAPDRRLSGDPRGRGAALGGDGGPRRRDLRAR